MTLAEFLAARLDEDETDARHVPQDLELYAVFQPTAGHGRAAEFAVRRVASRERVLREVEAKRKILAELEREADRNDQPGGNPNDYHGYREVGLFAAVQCLAAVWSDHPDYQQEWA